MKSPFLLASVLIACLGTGTLSEPDREQVYGSWVVAHPTWTSDDPAASKPFGALRLTPEGYTFEPAKGQEALVEKYRDRVPFIHEPEGAVAISWPEPFFAYVKFEVENLSEREYGIVLDEEEKRLRFLPMFSVAFGINDQPLVIKRLPPAAE